MERAGEHVELTDGMRAADDGMLRGGDLPTRAQLMLGALCEAGMLLARSGDPASTLPVVAGEAQQLLSSLRQR